MAGTYNRNTYNSALYNAGRDDRGAIIRSIIQAHTGPHIQAVVGSDPRLPANQSGISFISDFTIIEGVVRKPPLCYNFPDLKAVMRVMQTGALDLDANVYAQRVFDMPACTYPVAFLPELRAFIFAYIEHDLGADIFGILAQLDLGAIIQIVQEDLGGFILGIESPLLGGRVFSQSAPNLGAIIWAPLDLPASIIPVIFSDLPSRIFAFHFSDMPAKMLGIPAPQLFARIKGFASATADLPAVMFSRLEELMNAKITALYPGPNDMIASIAHDGGADFNNMLASLRSRESASGDLIATIGREFEQEFDLQARLNFLSAITLAASISPWQLGVNDRFLAGILQPVHSVTIPASIESNNNLKNLSATIEALAGTTDLGAFLRAAETFVTAILTVSTMNAYDLRATIGRPECDGGSATAVLNSYLNAQHANDLGGYIQSFIEFNLGATINLKEIFYAMDSISVNFSPRANRPVIFRTTDTIGVTFSPFRGQNLGAVITAGSPRFDIGAIINAIILLPRVDPAVGRMTAMELRPDRDFDVQEIRLQMEGTLLDYFYVNGTDEAFISDGLEDWKINIRSFREIAVGLFGEFAAGRVCRLGSLTSYSTLDEAVRDCIAVVIGQQGESDMAASLNARGGIFSLPAIISASDTFSDMSARSNTVYPLDLGSTISAVLYNIDSPANIPAKIKSQGFAPGFEVEFNMNAALRAVKFDSLLAQVSPSGGYGNLFASIPKVWKFSSLAASLSAFTNQFGLALNTGSNAETEYVSGPSLEDMSITPGAPDFTISIWFRNVRGDTPTLWETIAGATNSFFWNDGFGFYWSNATTITFWMNEWSVYTVDATVADVLQWQHLVATYDGTTMSFYLNGVLKGTSSPPALDGATHPFNLGRANGSGEIYSRGNFDDVAIWSRELQSDEIFEIYSYGLGYPDLLVAGNNYSPSLLTMWWDMDDTVSIGSYPEISNRAGLDHKGTLVNGPVDETEALRGPVAASNNVSMDFGAFATYFRTTTGDNGVPITGTGDFSVMVSARSGSTGFDICVGAWNSAQTNGTEGSFRIKKNSSTFSNITNSVIVNTGGTAEFADHNTGTDTTGTTWYNWIVTFNSSAGVMRAYQDGVFNAQSGVLSGTRKDWSEFTIAAGRFSNGIVDHWYAEIDNVAVWDKVLSQPEIDEIYNGGVSESDLRVAGPEANLTAWYRLGESGDTLATLQDKSGNGHHMVRVGSTSAPVIVTNTST